MELPTESSPATGRNSPSTDLPEGGHSDEDYVAAIRGEKAPRQLFECSWVMQLCVLRGIRHHHGFATELRNVPDHPEFTRALNARQIMSDQMPDMVAAEEIPYCIWYPDVASEQTYYKLHQRYPQMRYQIGRACAAAGYISLYKQLDLLPDVSIAEEARDNRHKSGSLEIFEHIMRSSQKWSVMDDYTRSILLENPPPARYGLNGDTAVRSTLTLRRRYEKPGLFSRFGEGNYRSLEYGEHVPPYFNITEDWNIDEFDSALAEPIDMRVEARSAPNTEEMMQLLWNALPLDLPEGNKDILILMAAYYGDIDRYQRLRRPNYMLEAESSCIIRGIYHNTMFAKWMSLQPDNDRFRRAINARFIMSNDVSRITSDTPEWALPYLIWYPARACGPTYEEIVRRRPEMKHAVARACIVADYGPEWDRLNADPSPELFCEAKASSNPYYLEDLRRRCAEQGIEGVEDGIPERLGYYTANRLTENSSAELHPSAEVDQLSHGSSGGWILGADASKIELFACVPKELRPTDDFVFLNLEQLYFELAHPPPSETEESRAYVLRAGGSHGIPWSGHA